MNSPALGPTLLLVCTPFQGWVAQHLPADALRDPVDLLYYTRNNSPEDRHTFDRLRIGKRRAHYMYVPKRRPDILNHILGYFAVPKWVRQNVYATLCLSSIETPTICTLSSQHSDARLLTFDDGIGNILRTSTFHVDPAGARMKLYRRLLNTPSPASICSRSARHYTLYPEFDNIVPRERVHPIETGSAPHYCAKQGEGLRYFIGQPFEFVLSSAQIARIAANAGYLKPDAYVRHPRERHPILPGVPCLEKNGEIAEDAIVRHAEGRSIELIGFFSSTMVNLHNQARNVRCIIPQDYKDASSMLEISEKLNFDIMRV